MKNIKDYLTEDSIAIMHNSNHDEVIEKLLSLASSSDKVRNHDKLRELIIERETIISTGIGVGLAIPHTRHEIVSDFVISAVLIQEGCDWNSIDNIPVRFAIMIASPLDTHREYLRILAQTVLFWKDQNKRENVFNAKTPADILKALSEIEFELL